MRDRGLKCLADFAHIGGRDVEAHLTDLAVDGNVAPSTQNQAFHALLFLFEHVFQRDIGHIKAVRASKGKQIPTVLSESEVERVFDQLHGVHLVIAQLLYGCGMRISEALRLRVKDVDFENSLIEIHQSKGDRSRIGQADNRFAAWAVRVDQWCKLPQSHSSGDWQRSAANAFRSTERPTVRKCSSS